MKEKDGFYLCEECGLRYREEIWAKKCEEWCKSHASCNIEIMQHAVQESELKFD
ncbi:MAG: hypothetical protein ACFFF4_14990 [Candidatus Thorarchaeota archaeon]